MQHIPFFTISEIRDYRKSAIPTKKNEAEDFIQKIAQENKLRWHIPCDFRIMEDYDYQVYLYGA